MKIIKDSLIKPNSELEKSQNGKLQREPGREMVFGPRPRGALTVKLFGHQQHWEVLIYTPQPAAVDLEKLQGFCL